MQHHQYFNKLLKVKSLAENTLKLLLNDKENIILVAVSIGTKNWGDALNLPLVHQISGKIPVVAYRSKFNFFNPSPDQQPVYSVIGSVLESSSNEKALVIWGSGFISSKGKLHNEPQQICAVRGPLTRERIIESGFDCPNIFGDPALLYPLFYRPRIQKKYKLGIIPHYVDQRCPSLKMFSNNPDVLMIDIRGGINQVVDKICSCEYIASSSLHGIIASDAYRVPSIWIRLSDSVAGGGLNSEIISKP